MGEPTVSTSASALLAMLRREGGFWTVSQLVRHWQPTWSADEVEHLLQELRHVGYLVRRPSLASAQVQSYSALPAPRAMPAYPLGPRPTADRALSL